MKRISPEGLPEREFEPLSIVSTPGKIILSGEHGVVYGRPALLSAVGLRCTVRCYTTPDQVVSISSKGQGDSFYSFEHVLNLTRHANSLWEKFSETKNFAILKDLLSHPAMLPALAAGEALSFLGISELKRGMRIEIDSELPLGSGMGSSAAVSTAIIAGVLSNFGRRVTEEELSSLVFNVERKQHGFPSGGDNVTVISGGFIRFERKNSAPLFKPIEVSRSLPSFVVFHSGRPTESTGEMVSAVRGMLEQRPRKVEAIFDRIAAVTERFIEGVQNSGTLELGELLRENQRLLERLGVVGEKATGIIRKVERSGGSAKICGAGGVIEGSGILLCYHKDPAALLRLAQREDVECLGILRLGAEGVRYE